MLLELLIDASLRAPQTSFARLLRDINQALLEMAELDAREGAAAQLAASPPSHTALAGRPTNPIRVLLSPSVPLPLSSVDSAISCSPRQPLPSPDPLFVPVAPHQIAFISID